MYGEAGFERSQDCRVTVELRSDNGIIIDVHGVSKTMFGERISVCVEEKLRELEVTDAYVEIFDEGSLDFVICARIKTAVNRARKEKKE